ncbi:MAG TPA: flagellar biosynthesis protein FlhF [Steroidobacteraceae bacterium]|nr:flagellar biosynthesis protein FlhF [Steroidobacteraceae bacterium]
MRIQRFIAKDMRTALAQVRDALGTEAVILSSGRIGSDVEVTAAMDMEVQRAVASAALAPPPARPGETITHPAIRPTDAGRHPDSIEARAARAEARRLELHGESAAAAAPATAQIAPAATATDAPRARRASSQLSEQIAPAAALVPADAPLAADETQGALAEMKDMRRMLEAQLATLAWNDMSRRSPIQAAMLKELAQLGITQDLANSLVRKLPAGLNFSAARRFALATIARTIQTTGDRWLEKGGVVAFAGPAGAGKTTLLAKLAARWVLRHGPRSVAIVSADSVRIGAHEQMHMLGRLLGVTTHNVYDVAELPELLYELRSCRFVMIDTAGTSPRDPELARRLRLLNQLQASIETSLVLPASTQAGAIDEVIQRFALAKPSSCVITKVDEAVSLGGVLSALIRHKLPAAYLSDGQRVPEDLSPARSHTLVSRAVEIASHNGATADDEVMQRRMSGGANGRKG